MLPIYCMPHLQLCSFGWAGGVLEPLSFAFEYSSVAYPLFYQLEQLVVRCVVKILFDVHINNPIDLPMVHRLVAALAAR